VERLRATLQLSSLDEVFSALVEDERVEARSEAMVAAMKA
jgi:hypothetical protein